MDNKILINLDYFKILNILDKYSITYLGKEKVLNLKPSSNSLEINSWQDETLEATSYILKQHDIPLAPISNIDEQLNKVNIDGVLSIHELICISDVLYVSRQLKNSFSNGSIETIDYPILESYFENLYSNQNWYIDTYGNYCVVTTYTDKEWAELQVAQVKAAKITLGVLGTILLGTLVIALLLPNKNNS